MKTLLLIFILIGGGYLCVQFFPTFFGIAPSKNTSYETYPTLSSKDPSLTSETSLDYVLVTCGTNCENCGNSLPNCNQIIEEQTALFCQNGEKGSAVCYYDFESLSNACQQICSSTTTAKTT